MWESKEKYPTHILLVRSGIMVRCSGMLSWRCWIFGYPGSSLRVDTMEVMMLSMCIFSSCLSDIHLHTSIITCLGFVFVFWSSVFSGVYIDREEFSRMILGWAED